MTSVPKQTIRGRKISACLVTLTALVSLWHVPAPLNEYAPSLSVAEKVSQGSPSANLSMSVFPRDEKDTKSAGTSKKTDFTIVVLTMNRLKSLQRLLDSLMLTFYDGDSVDLVIRVDRPAPNGDIDGWEKTIHWISETVHWIHGSFYLYVSEENLGLQRAWFEAWNPSDEYSRAVILEDDVEVARTWYRWVRGSYEAYSNRTDVAGISLQRQQLIAYKGVSSQVPINQHKPFLYRLVGSIGFAPIAKVWKNFIEWTKCALARDIDLHLQNSHTMDFYYGGSERMMWTQHFIYFTNHYDLYTLYLSLPDDKTMAAHWREPGAYFQSSEGKDFELATDTPTFSYPEQLEKYGWAGENASEKKRKTLVMSGAVGYDISFYHQFVNNLRNVYNGEIHLLIGNESASAISTFLAQHDVKTTVTGEKRWNIHRDSDGWMNFNRDRFQWYKKICRNHWLCAAVDFRDTIFQLSPFVGLDVSLDTDFFVYQHHLKMNNWHFERLNHCNVSTDYRLLLEEKYIINAGGLIGTPAIFEQLAKIMQRFPHCNDQVVLNIAVYSGLINATVNAASQGTGNINNVGYGARVERDKHERILNDHCLPSPVVHQLDEAV